MFRAAAVMTGAAAECALFGLRDLTIDRLSALSQPIPKGMKERGAKLIADALCQFFNSIERNLIPSCERASTRTGQHFSIRFAPPEMMRGHPANIDPVTPDIVHAALLVFPELARTTYGLRQWVEKDFTQGKGMPWFFAAVVLVCAIGLPQISDAPAGSSRAPGNSNSGLDRQQPVRRTRSPYPHPHSTRLSWWGDASEGHIRE